jgi:hypothetical protein
MNSEEAFEKSPYFSTKHSTYFEVYDELLESYKGRDLTFVEIGVLSGGSLFMWREFFGPGARIIGIDINPTAKKWESFGFEIWVGDQSDPSFWANFIAEVGPLDVVLDDGGHTYKQQITTAINLLPAVSDGGLLIVEDTHTSYMSGYGNRKFSLMRWTFRLMDAINSRFSGLKGVSPGHISNLVWKISTYESIVGYHVDQRKSRIVSKVSNNLGHRDDAIDLRNTLDNHAFSNLLKLGRPVAFVLKNRFIAALYVNLVKLGRLESLELKRLFRSVE